jgi:DNA-binding NtrC family response regulator
MENTKKLTVFVVDDDPIYRTYIAKNLRKVQNIQLKVFDSAEHCIKAMKHFPDLVILDYYLDSAADDNKNGWEALMNIKHTAPDVPVIMLSSEINIEHMMDCIKFGAEDYIIKGNYTVKRILTIIDELFVPGYWEMDFSTSPK